MYIDFSSFFDQSLRETAGFYPAKSHEKAFLRISDGITHHHSVFFLRGVEGVGKTHILKRLYRKPESSLRKAWLSAHQPTVNMIMQSFADLYGMRWDAENPNTLRKRMAEDIKSKMMPVIYIDNVASIDVQTMIKLSQILRWRKHSLAKVVFAGRFNLNPALMMFVKHNNVKAMQCKLYPLDEAEVHAYLVQLSRVSGYAGKSPFDKGSIHALIKHSKGIPNKINQLCDFCLFIARTHNHFVLDAALVNKAAEDLKKLQLWTLDDEKHQKIQLSSTDDNVSGSEQSLAVPGMKQDSSFHIKKSISVRVSVKKDHLSQRSDIDQPILEQDSQLAESEWNRAVNSYLLKHPKETDGDTVNQVVSKSYFQTWLLTLLVLSLLAGGFYYLLNNVDYSNIKLPEFFQSTQPKAVNSKQNSEDSTVTELSTRKPDLTQSNEGVESALILAVWNNKVFEIKELLQLGVDINTRNHFGQSPLMIAAMLGNEQIVTLMLENEAALDVVDSKGLTALMLAARNGQSNVVGYLLSHGADVNIQDKRGLTAIMHASAFGHQETVETILQYKPELELKDSNGQSADAIAQNLGYENIAQMIQKIRLK